MWADLLGLIAIIAFTAIAQPGARVALQLPYAAFTSWHRALSLVAIAAATGHILGSGYYVSTWPASLTLVALVAVTLLGHRRLASASRLGPRAPREFLYASRLAITLFALVRNVGP